MAANILIVEDENAILELIALNLHQSGFNPLRAISAEIADSLVKNTLPDLIVLGHADLININTLINHNMFK